MNSETTQKIIALLQTYLEDAKQRENFVKLALYDVPELHTFDFDALDFAQQFVSRLLTVGLLADGTHPLWRILEYLKLRGNAHTVEGSINALQQFFIKDRQDLGVPTAAANAEAIRVFISYSSRDTEHARLLAQDLARHGIAVVRDQDFILPGQTFTDRIDLELRSCHVVVLVVTNNALTSHWVRSELNYAIELKKVIVPVIIQPQVEVPFYLKLYQYVDMHTPALWQTNLSRLVESIREQRQRGRFAETAVTTSSQSASRSSSPSIFINPFIVGRRVVGDQFFGRASILQVIVDRILTIQHTSVIGILRSGKTSLLQQIANTPSLLPSGIAWLPVYLDMKTVDNPTSAMRLLRKEIVTKLDKQFHPLLWSEQEDGQVTAMLVAIKELHRAQLRVVFLFDEWETVQSFANLDGFVNGLRQAGSLGETTMVTATLYPLSDLHKSGSVGSPFHNIFRTYFLGLMPMEERKELVVGTFQRSGRHPSDDEVDLILELGGSQPYFLQLAGSIVWDSKKENLSREEIAAEFRDQAKPIFADIVKRQLIKQQRDVLLRLTGRNTTTKLDDRVFNAGVSDLKKRGVLDDTAAFFSKEFETFVRQELE
ncbi:MAG: toll/interleukin-1 receptor domain-containing protein [Chloroflexi bacterium]|nr:toll/interleukin-1 receptor domain-containing protein [Chloroflexota bacterium]